MHTGGVARFEVEVAPPPSDRRASAYGRWFPSLVLSFVLINTAVFVVSMFLNNCPKNSMNCFAAGLLGRFAFQPLKENPLVGPSSTTKFTWAGLFWCCSYLCLGIILSTEFEYQIGNSLLLLHLLANMLSLLIIGIRLEQEFGFGVIFSHSCCVYCDKLGRRDSTSCIGGFLSGFLLGFVLLVRPQSGWSTHGYNLPGYPLLLKSKFKTYQYILWIISFILLVVVVGLVVAPSDAVSKKSGAARPSGHHVCRMRSGTRFY